MSFFATLPQNDMKALLNGLSLLLDVGNSRLPGVIGCPGGQHRLDSRWSPNIVPLVGCVDHE